MRRADRILRLLALHAAIGAFAGVGLAAAIAALDIAGLRGLAARDEDGCSRW